MRLLYKAFALYNIYNTPVRFGYVYFSLKVYLVLLPVDWTDKFLTLKLMSFFSGTNKTGKSRPISYPLWFKEVILRLVRINWDVFLFPTWFILCSRCPILMQSRWMEQFSLKFTLLWIWSQKCSTDLKRKAYLIRVRIKYFIKYKEKREKQTKIS